MTIHLCLFNHMANGFVSKVTNNQQQMLKCKEDFGEDIVLTGVHNILLSAGVVQDLDFDFCLGLASALVSTDSVTIFADSCLITKTSVYSVQEYPSELAPQER